MKTAMSLPLVLRLFLPTILVLLTQACGNAGVDLIEIKEYRLFLENDDALFRKEMTSLVESFNTNACVRALTLSDNRNEANSFITITDGLEQKSKKVGFGEWERRTSKKNPVTFSNDRAEVTRVYSMNLEFDRDFFIKRMNANDDRSRNELFKLFSHEAGHGLEMTHIENDPRNVMYPDISGDKDFPSFFLKVREYFNASQIPSC